MQITLQKPIEAHGETITTLTLREAKGGDIRKCGAPYKIEFLSGDQQIMHIDTAAVARLISALAGIPPSSVDAMSAGDFTQAQTLILGFFGDASPKSA